MEFFIEMLDVAFGESYILNFKRDNRMVRILVDGGSEKKVKNLENILEKIKSSSYTEQPSEEASYPKLNGIIVTHIDDDHIGGILNLLNLQDVERYVDLTQDCFILFNDFVDPATITYNQGVQLKQLIDKHPMLSLVRSYRKNERFRINGFEVCIQNLIHNNNPLKPIAHEKDIIFIDILLPEKATLIKLMKKWFLEKGNSKLKNESSIVFTVEYREKRVLLTGDHFFSKIIDRLHSLKDKHISFDLIKLAHHGAKPNNERITDLIDRNRSFQAMLPLYKNTNFHPSYSTLSEILKYEQSVIYVPSEPPNREQLESLQKNGSPGAQIIYADTIQIL